MKSGSRRKAPRASSFRKARRRTNDPSKRRYENAWDDNLGYSGGPDAQTITAPGATWRTVRRLAHTRAGRVVILAPLGAIGAILLLRRRHH